MYQNQQTLTFDMEGDVVLIFCDRLCVPNVIRLRHLIMEDAHHSRYFITPGSTNMYHDIMEIY